MQPYWLLWIWNSLNGCRIWPLRSTQTPFIKIHHSYENRQHNKWSLLNIAAFSHYIEWSFLLPFCLTICWEKYVQYCLKFGLIWMKFSLYSVGSLLAKLLNKTRISTAHITAYIQPRYPIYKLTLSGPLQIHCCFPKCSSLWCLKLNWSFWFPLQFPGYLTSGGTWMEVGSCWVLLTNLTIFSCSQLSHKKSDTSKIYVFHN